MEMVAEPRRGSRCRIGLAVDPVARALSLAPRALRFRFLLGSLFLGRFPANVRRVFPEPLELVVRTIFLVEDVNDDVRVVEQQPAQIAFPFAPDRLRASATELVLDGIPDRFDLPVGRAGDDHEIVGDRDELAYL